MASPLGVSLLLVLLTGSICAGRDFIVGEGPSGWATNPAEPRDHFQINDTLDFKYDKDLDAVLSVNKSQYEACNTTGPLFRCDAGECHFALDSSGHHYFIGADATRCQAGERLKVFVRAAHDNDTTPAPPPKPASSSSAPPIMPASPSPPALMTAPVPRTKNVTSPLSTSSSAVALRAGVLACLVTGAAAATL